MSYFGIVVSDGYNWDQCYSWAWECRHYWDTDRDGDSVSVHDAFPDIPWNSEQRGLMEQVMAINNGLAERPKKVYFKKTVIVRR